MILMARRSSLSSLGVEGSYLECESPRKLGEYWLEVWILWIHINALYREEMISEHQRKKSFVLNT